MKADKSHQFMDFMMKSFENMEMRTLGNTAQRFLITLALQLQQKEKFFVFMLDYLLLSTQQTKCERSKDAEKFLLKVHFAILCGQTLKTFKLGQCLQEGQDGSSGQRLSKNSTESMTSLSFAERINQLMKDTKYGSQNKVLSQSGPRLTTATDVEMLPRFYKLMRRQNKNMKSSKQSLSPNKV